ncbi:hypothetical protein TNCV_2200691 [Trichonephila clavipes]|nr:hypothetical protein TNCV_2200691 [Trichonephila clavipes]
MQPAHTLEFLQKRPRAFVPSLLTQWCCQTPPNAEDLKTCSRILEVFEYQLIKKTRLPYNQQILFTMDNGLVRKNQESYDLIEKENGKLMEEIQDLEVNDSSKKLELDYQKSNAKLYNDNPSPIPPKKKNRLDGFTAPPKVVKKQKVLQNYSFGVAAPLTTTNKYQTLSGKDALPAQDNTAMPVAPKFPPKPSYKNPMS